MSRRIENSLSVRKKVRARGAAVARGNHLHVRPVDVHRVDLIAFASITRRLKYQFPAICRKVRLSIFAAKGELLDIAQVLFLRQCQITRLGCGGPCSRETPKQPGQDQKNCGKWFHKTDTTRLCSKKSAKPKNDSSTPIHRWDR